MLTENLNRALEQSRVNHRIGTGVRAEGRARREVLASHLVRGACSMRALGWTCEPDDPSMASRSTSVSFQDVLLVSGPANGRRQALLPDRLKSLPAPVGFAGQGASRRPYLMCRTGGKIRPIPFGVNESDSIAQGLSWHPQFSVFCFFCVCGKGWVLDAPEESIVLDFYPKSPKVMKGKA